MIPTLLLAMLLGFAIGRITSPPPTPSTKRADISRALRRRP